MPSSCSASTARRTAASVGIPTCSIKTSCVAAGTLVDAFRQRAHCRNAFRNFLTEEHAAATGLGALANDDFNGVGPAQIVGVHTVAGGEILIDQRLGMSAFFLRHATVAGCRRS